MVEVMSGNCGVTDAVAAVPGPYVRPSVASEVHDCGRTVFVRAEPVSVDDTSTAVPKMPSSVW